jgi:uncharacterized protein
VEIEFDPAKDRANRRKHGVSLALAAELDWNAMWVRADDAGDYGEDRWIGVGPKGTRRYTVVFTVRDDDETMCIVSLRRATNQEIKCYEGQNAKT